MHDPSKHYNSSKKIIDFKKETAAFVDFTKSGFIFIVKNLHEKHIKEGKGQDCMLKVHRNSDVPL